MVNPTTVCTWCRGLDIVDVFLILSPVCYTSGRSLIFIYLLSIDVVGLVVVFLARFTHISSTVAFCAIGGELV